jgi:hypothetical protein
MEYCVWHLSRNSGELSGETRGVHTTTVIDYDQSSRSPATHQDSVKLGVRALAA